MAKISISEQRAKRIHERIYFLRKNHPQRPTQAEAADTMGMMRSSLNMYESGERIPPADKLIALADYYGVSVDYLLVRTDVKTNDIDVASVCKEIGLSENACACFCSVDELMRIEPNNNRLIINEKARRSLLNLIISSPEMTMIISAVLEIIKYSQEEKEYLQKNPGKINSLYMLSHPDYAQLMDKIELRRYRALTYYQAILTRLSNIDFSDLINAFENDESYFDDVDIEELLNIRDEIFSPDSGEEK
ncbi:MAG: helix-turn-helix domain-containing protein [Bacillota bacterium]|jgi:transcriptional regulator with XRE-family HTH domain